MPKAGTRIPKTRAVRRPTLLSAALGAWKPTRQASAFSNPSCRAAFRVRMARSKRRTSEITVFARGLQKQVVTRLYFAGDAANASDPVLSMVPAERRDTLLAHPVPFEPGDCHIDTWHMDIRLQGEGETVFFDV